MGAEYSNSGDKRKALDAYHRALDLYTEVGDKAGQGDTLMWLGFANVEDAPPDALSYFEKALPLLQGGPRRYAEAVASAAIEALRGAGRTAGTEALKVYQALCDVLEAREDGIRFVGQPGFAFNSGSGNVDAALGIDILQSAGQNNLLVGAGWHQGDTWQAQVFSYTLRPLHLTGLVVSDCERVAVPAGTFGNCLHVRLDVSPDPDDDGPERNQRLNRVNCGEKHIWYARGVGLVRFTFERRDDARADIQLAKCHLSGFAGGYMPLAVGNRWEYQAVGFDANYVQESVYEVLTAELKPAERMTTYHLRHWAFAYREEGAQQ